VCALFCFIIVTVREFSQDLVVVNVGQATGIRLGTVVQNLSSIVTGIVIAFVYSWEFALFIIGLSPFFIAAGFLEMKMMAGFSGTEALEGAGQVSILVHLATCSIVFLFTYPLLC